SILDYVFRELAVNYLGRHDLAQVAEDDLSSTTTGKRAEEEVFDDLGDGDEEDDRPATVVEAVPLPQRELPRPDPLLQGARPNGHEAPDAGRTGSTVVERLSVRQLRLIQVREARIKGYEGDPCSGCGQFTLVRNGTCLKCVACGATSGCS